MFHHVDTLNGIVFHYILVFHLHTGKIMTFAYQFWEKTGSLGAPVSHLTHLEDASMTDEGRDGCIWMGFLGFCI
jgi:hypothetical protein